MAQPQNPMRGFLATVGLSPEVVVEFQYNPTSLSDKRTVTYASLNAPALVFPVRQYSQGGDRTLSFTVQLDGLFDGPIPIAKDEFGSILPELNKYRLFLYPVVAQADYWKTAGGSFAGFFGNVTDFTAPPTCLLGFGEGREI